MSMKDLIYPEESYAIVGAAMEVYNSLGRGFLEAVYQEALALELSERDMPFEQQLGLSIYYKGRLLRKNYIADFVVYDKILLEVKSLKQLTSLEDAQMLNYLKATGFRLGLLLNFGAAERLEHKRLVK
jgi:GxxExxY protein